MKSDTLLKQVGILWFVRIAIYVSDSPIKMARVMNVALGQIGKHVNSWSVLLIKHTTATRV